MTAYPQLSVAQSSKLDRIAKDDPQATVVAWQGGPVVRRGDGRLQRVVVTGRINPVRGKS